jgi:hypothetical protein
MHEERQIPVWFFIGGLLLIYGIIIIATGLWGLVYPSDVLKHLRQTDPNASWFFYHPEIWWGFLLVALGSTYCIRFGPWRKQG